LLNNKKFKYFLYCVGFLCIASIIFLNIYSKDHRTSNKDVARTASNEVVKKTINNKKKVIAVSVLNDVNEYWNDLIKGIKAHIKDEGYEVIISQENDSAENQMKSISGFIDKGVDAIIVASIDETVLEPYIRKALNRGIIVVGHLHDLSEFNVQYGPKEYEMGFIAGRYMGKLLKDKGVENPRLAMFTYPEIVSLIDREKGIEDGLREFVPETIIVAKVPGDKPDTGKTAALDIIKKFPDLNGFVGINDNGLLGALDAANETGISKRSDFFIVGIGGDGKTLNSIINESPFKATVNIDPWLNGYNEVSYIQEMFEGKKYINKIVYFSPLTIVDKLNVYDVIMEKKRRDKLIEKQVK
jgi:ribose transport system substrate-binding protein